MNKKHAAQAELKTPLFGLYGAKFYFHARQGREGQSPLFFCIGKSIRPAAFVYTNTCTKRPSSAAYKRDNLPAVTGTPVTGTGLQCKPAGTEVQTV